MHINKRRSNVNNGAFQNSSFEITYFKLFSFDNIMIEILAHVEYQNERLMFENNQIFKYRILFLIIFMNMQLQKFRYYTE